MNKWMMKKYINEGGEFCPYCDSDNLDSGDIHIDTGYASQEIWCRDCKEAWYDEYELVNVEPQ